MTDNYNIVKMHRFENEPGQNFNNAITKSIIMYGCEILILLLPLILVFLASTLFDIQSITLKSIFINKDIIWFSISTLVLFNFRKILSNKSYSTLSAKILSKALDFLIIFFILVYSAVYIVIELYERGIINEAINDTKMLWLVLASFFISSIINIAYIILAEGD